MPTGVDSTTGATPSAFVSADATLTLAMPKIGLRDNDAIGDLYLGNISVLTPVYEALGYDSKPPFHEGPILQVL